MGGAELAGEDADRIEVLQIGQVEVAEADEPDRFPCGGHWPGWTWRTT